MKRTYYGLIAMTLSLVLGFVIALGSLSAMGGKLDTNALNMQVVNLPTILVSCLDPIAIGLEILAILLILLDSRTSENPQRTLAWIAAGSFLLWAILNLGVFMPLSFIGMQRDSLAIVKAGQIIKAIAALLQYCIPFLLIYGLTEGKLRALLWLGLLLSIVGNFFVVILPIEGIKLQAIETMGQTLYTPTIQVDYNRGIYPILLALGYWGGALYLIVYGTLSLQNWRKSHQSFLNEATI